MDYSVNLLGVSVNGTRLPIPNGTFALDPNTGDAPAATLLVNPAYTTVVEAFKARISKSYKVVSGSGLLCFMVDASKDVVVAVPPMTMHFDGMDMELQQKN
uniref:Xylanase inhibitor C-terminal domain-containing protein n=1 Tax=Oryza punctata TaxID=4537 RepID=A0A0E0LLM0_ORYPU